MKSARITSLAAPLMIGLGMIGFTSAANAGCLKGAIIGGLAGHLVHHGVLGAAAGCAYGAHEQNKYDREETGEGRSSSDQRGGGRS